MRVHPKPKRDKTRGCHEEGYGGGEDWELGIWQNDKKQSPTVEHRNYIQYTVINHMKKNVHS